MINLKILYFYKILYGFQFMIILYLNLLEINYLYLFLNKVIYEHLFFQLNIL